MYVGKVSFDKKPNALPFATTVAFKKAPYLTLLKLIQYGGFVKDQLKLQFSRMNGNP